MPVRFRILGPVEIEVDGRVISPPRRRERCLLGVLLLEANRPVSIDRLAELLWEDDPPKRVRGALQGHISRLRTALAAAGVDSDVELLFAGDGYRLAVDPETVDAHLFRTLRERAVAIAEPAERVAQLRVALDLWRGPALADALSDSARGRWCSDLEEQRLDAFEEMVTACLLLRREREILPDLARVASTNPGRESLVGLHMRALYQTGRRADALDVYAHARTYLTDELGLDPGPELRELHQAVLRDELTLPVSASGSRPQSLEQRQSTPALIPRQLPADVASFTGRRAQLEQLDSLVTNPGGQATAVVISAIGGTAGVGKTALAIHWAHRVIDDFPDGQLYVNLRGYDPDEPMTSRAALAKFLTALAMPEADLPQDLDDRAARFRSEIAGRQMLIVLDNASNVEQVRPLLPGSSSCTVVVTSRDSLAGLVALHGAHRLNLDPLPPNEAVMLLRRLVGSRVDAEPDAAATLASQCARLPLALRVASELAASRPDDTLADLVVELADRQRRLDLLDAGDDPRAVVRTVFSWSFQHLPSDAANMFRLLGLHPGPDIDPYAAAALTNTSLEHAGRALDLLTRAHLLHSTGSRRWGMHDLLRAYAAELTTIHDSDQIRHAAMSRLLDHYRHTASVAADTAYPYERERRPRVPQVRSPAPGLPDLASAIAWMEVELPNLLAVARYAAAGSAWPEHTWHLSAILHRHLRTRGRYRDAEALHQQALTTARATGNRAAESTVLIGLGDVHRLQGGYREAADHYRQALEVARASGNPVGELNALNGLGWVRQRLGRQEQAADCHQRALEVARATGHRSGELDAFIGLGHLYRQQDLYEQAADYHQRALQIARATGNRFVELGALNVLGAICWPQGRYEQAADYHQRALQIARATGNPVGELNALNGLGWVHQLQGRYELGADHHQQALEIARTTSHRNGELWALNSLGWVRLRQGRLAEAADHYQQLLDLARHTADRNWQFEAMHGLGRLRHTTGDPNAAVAHHETALALATDLGQPDDQARAHDGLAHAYWALHQHEPARAHWRHALNILTGLGVDHTKDEQVTVSAIRAQLADHGQVNDMGIDDRHQ